MTEIIVTSSALILLLAILRRVMRKRISPCVQYALWLLAAARLLIPGTPFTAPVSVLEAASRLQASIHETFPEPDPLPEPAASSQLSQQADQLPAQQPQAAAAAYTPVLPGTVRRVNDWPDFIWKTGMAVTGIALALSNLLFYIRLRKSRKPAALPAAPWSGGLPVYKADGLPSPCLFGLFRPAIYLNEAAVEVEHPEHILAHEYAHYRHGDHLWSILRCICLVIHWYNPLVWWAAVMSRRDCELACDASALKLLGEEKRIDYGQTLLGMVSKQSSPAALLHMATTMTAGKRAMTERIALIIKQPKTRKITLALVAALACLLAVCVFSGAADKKEDHLSAQSTALMEYPGLHWNDSMETVIASPEEMVLTQKGQSFQFLPENAYGIYASAYSSSNPVVAGVTQDGTVTALNCGEA